MIKESKESWLNMLTVTDLKAKKKTSELHLSWPVHMSESVTGADA